MNIIIDKVPIPIVITLGTFNAGGMERAVLSFLKEIDRSRFSAHVICFQNTGLLQSQFEALNLPICVIRLRSWNFFSVALRVTRYLKRNKIALIHSHCYQADVVARLAGRMAKVPTINTIHTNSTWKRNPSNFKMRFKRFIDSYTARFCSNGFIALTASIKDFHINQMQYPTEQWLIAPNPLDLTRLNVGVNARAMIRKDFKVRPNEILILAVGNLLPVKGHSFLIDAISLLPKRIQDKVKLFILGEGDLKEKLENKIKFLELTSRIHLLGYFENVGSALAASDIYAMPSLSEGQSLAILEAMFMRRPLLVTSQGGHTEFLRHNYNAIIVPPSDAQSLANGLEFLVSSTSRSKLLAENAWTTLKTLKISQSTKMQESFYEKIVEG